MGKKRLIDATDLVRRVLEERDKIKLETVERYSFGVATPDRYGQHMRGGIHKALRCIEKSPTIDAVEVVRCQHCLYRDMPGCCPYQSLGYRVTHDWYCPMGVKKNVEKK